MVTQRLGTEEVWGKPEWKGMAEAWKQRGMCGRLWAALAAGVLYGKWIVVVTDSIREEGGAGCGGPWCHPRQDETRPGCVTYFRELCCMHLRFIGTP